MESNPGSPVARVMNATHVHLLSPVRCRKLRRRNVIIQATSPEVSELFKLLLHWGKCEILKMQHNNNKNPLDMFKKM